MRALASLAACFGLVFATPALAFMHPAAHGGAHLGPQGRPAGDFHGRHGFGGGRRNILGADGVYLGDPALMQDAYGFGPYGEGDAAAPPPEPTIVPAPVPVPIPVPVCAGPRTAAADVGPRIIFIGHAPEKAHLPKVIYGVH